MAANTPRLVLHPLRTVAEFGHPVLAKYLRDRGPHLGAMVAYYALLSLVPFLFLTASLLAFAGHVSPNSYLIRELAHILPGQSARDLLRTVHAIQHEAGTIGAIGFLGLVWGTLGFYSALESALNIVYGVQNRAFLHQKWVTFVLVTFSLLVLFASLIVTTAATGWYHRHVPHLIDLKLIPFVVTLAASSAGIFLFLMVVYRVLTNVDLRVADVWPGALVGMVLYQGLFSVLSLYLRFSDQLLALRAFGGLVLLLVWLYLMTNILILGAEINWWHWSRRQPPAPELDGLA
ncbi:MAG TPA: YihY/virulence factor BrkB family protein [Gaiellales bacterium]|jgi:membrane protein